MKTSLKFAVAIMLLAGVAGNTARAESQKSNHEENVVKEIKSQNDSQATESLINKIEAAQKEQMMRFVQKKHLISNSDLI